MTGRFVGGLLTGATILCLAGCNSSSGKTSSGKTVTVFAAASLTDAFEDMAQAFEQEHKDLSVRLSFAGSQSLRTQIQHGAEAQVFASANPKHMNILLKRNLVREPTTFAHNQLVLVVSREASGSIKTLEDIASKGQVVLADKSVPAGEYAEKMLDKVSRAGVFGPDFKKKVLNRLVSRETHVRNTLQKVIIGEADAAIVYATDARAARGKVVTIEIPDQYNVMATYPITIVKDTPNQELGELFIQFVLSETGRAVLTKHGIKVP